MTWALAFGVALRLFGCNVVAALQPLPPGKTIAAEQLILRKGLCPAPGVTQLDSIELAAGRKPVRAIQTGAPIYAPMLAVPHEVERGDRINVEVSRGAVVLAFEAIAESTGRAGESIIVRNPANGRRFQARVQEKGKVSVKK